MLERIADLQFSFAYGACGTFRFPEERVVFCFAQGSEQKCFRLYIEFLYKTLQGIGQIFLSYNGETSMNLPDSKYWHQRTTLGNIENNVLAVGSSGPENNNQVEVFDTQSSIWTTRARYPFCSSR